MSVVVSGSSSQAKQPKHMVILGFVLLSTFTTKRSHCAKDSQPRRESQNVGQHSRLLMLRMRYQWKDTFYSQPPDSRTDCLAISSHHRIYRFSFESTSDVLRTGFHFSAHSKPKPNRVKKRRQTENVSTGLKFFRYFCAKLITTRFQSRRIQYYSRRWLEHTESWIERRVAGDFLVSFWEKKEIFEKISNKILWKKL